MPVTKPCETCGKDVTRSPSLFRERVFCSKTCAYKGLTKDKPKARRSLYRPDHPLSGVNGYVAEHRVVLYEQIGPGFHPCHWCGKKVRWTRSLVGTGHKRMLVVDHVNSNEHDNRPENLVPSCQGCNATRWHHIQEDELYIVSRDGTRRRAVPRTCEQCGAPFLAAEQQVRVGRGRYCSMSCARKRPIHG